MAKIQSTDQSARKEDLRRFLELLLPYLGGGTSSTTTDSILSEDLTVSKSLGGISSGTVYQQGTSLESIIRDLLSDVATPRLTAPSISISANSSTQMKKGQTKEVTITATFSRGSISPAYGTSGYRSGEVLGYSLNGGEEQASNEFTVTVSEQNKNFTVTARYAEGEQPLDSTGQDYSTPLEAGTVTSNTISFSFEEISSIWSNAANNSVIAEETINKNVGTKTWTFAAQTKTSPEIFDIPATWTVTDIEVYNDFTRDYDDIFEEFDASTVQHDGVDYTRYTDNRGYAAGSRTVRIKWS